MEYQIGWHSDDEGHCHVALIDNEGKRDELFDVALYDPEVIEDGVTARERSLAKLEELVERANAAPDDCVSRESLIEALRDAERNDSAADAVEFVGTLIGWSAEDDEELQAELAAERAEEA